MNATISSIGVYHPKREVFNSFFEKSLDTSDEWIRERTGIERRFFSAPNEYTSDMCVKAAENLSANYNKDLADVDFIIVATTTPDQIVPSVAIQVQARLRIPHAGAIDISCACAGFCKGIREDKIQPNDMLMLMDFGGGFTYGGLCIQNNICKVDNGLPAKV